MRDYDNMPVLNWNDATTPQMAKAQILHRGPVILQMPDSFDASIDSDEFGCGLRQEAGILYDCEGGNALNRLAIKNGLPDLGRLAAACITSSSRVDIDSNRRRLIVHD